MYLFKVTINDPNMSQFVIAFNSRFKGRAKVSLKGGTSKECEFEVKIKEELVFFKKWTYSFNESLSFSLSPDAIPDLNLSKVKESKCIEENDNDLNLPLLSKLFEGCDE